MLIKCGTDSILVSSGGMRPVAMLSAYPKADSWCPCCALLSILPRHDWHGNGQSRVTSDNYEKEERDTEQKKEIKFVADYL